MLKNKQRKQKRLRQRTGCHQSSPIHVKRVYTQCHLNPEQYHHVTTGTEKDKGLDDTHYLTNCSPSHTVHSSIRAHQEHNAITTSPVMAEQ